MADITVTSAASSNADNGPYNVSGPWFDTNLHGIVVFINSSADLAYVETSDGGATWGAPVTLLSGTIDRMAAFFDGQNPNLSTTLLHIAFTDSGSTKLRYININVATLVASSDVDIAAVAATDPDWPCFITRTDSGNLIAGFRIVTSTYTYKSTTTGASWSSIASPYEGGTDLDIEFGFHFHGSDPNDGAILYGDLSASELSIKVYDDSANSWTETLISTGITIINTATSGTGFVSWAALSTNHVILTVWTQSDNAAADLLSFDINPTTVSSVSVTARTDVLTNSAESAATSVIADNNAGRVYVGYNLGGTWGTSVTPTYKYSDDSGVTWNAGAAIATVADAFPILSYGGTKVGVQARIGWAWGNAAGTIYTQTGLSGAALTPVVVLSGSLVPSAVEDSVAAGALTLVATITNGLNWATTIDDDSTTSEDFISALLSAGTEVLGWNNIVVGKFYRKEVMADSPLSYWRMGGTYTDLGSTNQTATATSLSAGAALLLSSVQASSVFNLAAAKLNCGSPAANDNLWDAGGTFETVILPWSDGFSTTQSRIASKIDGGAGWEIGLEQMSGGYVNLFFRCDFSTVQGVWKLSNKVPIGVQTHIAVTFNADSASNDPTFWINGIPYTTGAVGFAETTTPSGTRSSDAASTLWVGSNSSVALTYNGLMQEVALYATSLSATRIQAHVLAASNRYGLRYSNLARTSATVITLTMPAFPFYDITVAETITATFPSTAFVSGTSAVATPTFQITPTTRKTNFAPPANLFTPSAQTPGPFGNVNGGLGPAAGDAYRVLGAGDEWALGSPEMSVGIDGSLSGARVLMIVATEISEA